MLVPATLTALATGTEQGRDAIAATATQLAEIGPGRHAYLAQTLSIVLATLSALLLIGPAPKPLWITLRACFLRGHQRDSRSSSKTMQDRRTI